MEEETISKKVTTLLSYFEFRDVNAVVDEEHRRISIVIADPGIEQYVETLLNAFDQIIRLMLHKDGKPSFIVDVNYYRKERERLIIELARTAARKAMAIKQDVELPPMNAYERRLVHMEITSHPELTTESVGIGKERHTVIKRLE